MPGRIESLINHQLYHVFNKTIADFCPFSDEYYADLFMNLIRYYRSNANPGCYSKFYRQEPDVRQSMLAKINIPNTFLVEILAVCLMPDHYHFVLRQLKPNGISRFMGDLVNSFSRHYNTKEEKLGPIFLPRFKAIMIRSDEQLIHTIRYLDLNPHTSGIVVDLEELINYKWSSFRQYVTGEGDLCSTQEILSRFAHNPQEEYKQFVFDQADYQKALHFIKREKI